MKRSLMCVASLVLILCMLIPTTIMTANAKETFYKEATSAVIKSNIEKDAKLDKSATVQGACTDGEYAYFAVNRGSTKILKYNVSTWKLKKKSSSLNLGHANDMTYNSRKDLIIVANNEPDHKKLTFIDPDTLTVTGHKKIKLKIYSISYNESRNQYVVGISGTYNFAILDSNFKVVKKFKGVNTGYLRQGGDCDDNYVYFAQSGSSGNAIVVYTWGGKHVDTIKVAKSMEIENIFHVNNNVFITLHYFGNYVHRIGINDKTALKYKVKFDANGGQGEMKPITIKYGKYRKLPECKFEKEGYTFGGWIMKRDSYKTYYGKKNPYSENEWLRKEDIYEYSLFKDKNRTGKTTNLGDITATAFWIKNEYAVQYNSNGAQGTMPMHVVKYDESFKINKNRFTKSGYTFAGWSAKRSYDNKVFGYKKGQDEPKWLKPKHVHKLYVFDENESVEKLTYDKDVTFVAQWQSAFVFNKKGTVLQEYNGIDEIVEFPQTADKVKEIAPSAFANSHNMNTITIPETVTTIGEKAFENCENLSAVHFTNTMPENVDITAFNSYKALKFYLKTDGKETFIGLYTGSYSYDMLYNIYKSKFS